MTTKSVATARPAPRPVQPRANSPMLSHIHKVIGKELKEILVKESEIKLQRVVALAIFGVICTVLPFYLEYPLISIVFPAILLLYKLWLCKSKEYRTPLVLVWTIIGLLIGAAFIYMLGGTSLLEAKAIVKSHGSLIATIFLLFVSAPVSFYLWSCRNEDKLEQIKQADKQNKHNEEQSRLNSLSNAMRLFLENDDKHTKAVGLMTLAKIKEESSFFDAEIDMATSGAELQDINLAKANLTGINLSGADLTNANLSGATLTKANISGATLTKANLSGAILKEADLSSSILEGTNMADADFSGANIQNMRIGVYNDDKNKGILYREEIEAHLKQDWKTKVSKQEFDDYMRIFSRIDEEKYSLIKEGGAPSEMSDMSEDKPSEKSGLASTAPSTPRSEPKVDAHEEEDGKTDSDKGIPPDVTLYSMSDTIDAPLDSAADYCDRGVAKMEADDLDDAIADFDEAIKLDPNYAPAYSNRGVAKMRKHRKEENEE